MIILLIILVAACLVWLFHPRFNPQFAKPKENKVESPSNLSPKEATIMGKSKFVLSQPTTNREQSSLLELPRCEGGRQRQPKPNEATESQTDKGVDKETIFDPDGKKPDDAQVPKEEFDKSFSNTPEQKEPDEPNEPLEVDVTEEFDDDEDDTDLDDEAEELRQMLGNDVTSADGVGYDDLNVANKTALANDSSPEEDEQAGEVFHKIQPTDVFEQMIAGNVEKEDKVKSLMAMHLKKHYADRETAEGAKRDLSGFIN